jgi:hypothetical protein
VIRRAPIRTCLGCLERVPQAELLRIVAGPQGLCLDASRRAPGRGGYLHRRASCWAEFARRRGPVRSLRVTPGRPERERLVASLASVAAGR